MRWMVPTGRHLPSSWLAHRYHRKRALSTVPKLDSWDLGAFKRNAFDVGKPVKLLLGHEYIPPACSKWFVNGVRNLPELQPSFWARFKDTVVPLEVTLRAPGGDDDRLQSALFQRGDAPLEVLLATLTHPSSETPVGSAPSIYLAQCSLQSLPQELQGDLPTPNIVLGAGKGDIYESSLWLGRSPTYTPLHRDPNPNFFFQLAGKKIVRLLPPAVGNALFEKIQGEIRERHHALASSAAFRGEEMMTGPESDLTHEAVWDPQAENYVFINEYGQQAEVDACEALFIPKGWWHSVKGVGEGVTASANWWFR